MKKLLLSLVASCAFIPLSAQDDCMEFFPTTEGAVLINKTYNAKDTLLSIMTYRIDKSYDYQSGADIHVGFVMTDNKNNVIDQGNLNAYCEDGSFYLKMVNRALSPDIINALSSDTELVGDFLDYPNTFNEGFPFEGPFKMTGGKFTIQSKADKKDFVIVRIFNRQYEGNEKITTPVKTFDASKVSFDFDVTRDKQTMQYKWKIQCALTPCASRS